jgi:hypothetical protein
MEYSIQIIISWMMPCAGHGAIASTVEIRNACNNLGKKILEKRVLDRYKHR